MSKNKVEINGINTCNLSTLSQEEMKNLFISMHDGNKTSRDKLVEGNLRLVLSILRRYQNRCDNLDDLFQIGVLGLLKAIDNFDLSFGVRFSTYAVFMVEGEIKRFVRDNSQLRISRSIKELSYRIINYREEYLSKYFKYPSNEDICKKFRINNYELSIILSSLNEPVSMFEPVFNDGGDTLYLLDQIEDKKVTDLDDLLALKEAISKLSEREKSIIYKRYIDGLSQSEIAEGLSISQAQVSRIENGALNSIKKLVL